MNHTIDEGLAELARTAAIAWGILSEPFEQADKGIVNVMQGLGQKVAASVRPAALFEVTRCVTGLQPSDRSELARALTQYVGTTLVAFGQPCSHDLLLLRLHDHRVVPRTSGSFNGRNRLREMIEQVLELEENDLPVAAAAIATLVLVDVRRGRYDAWLD